uniref:Succinate dehydrogenase subunit 3 n=1 Tax=Melanothamnus gigas TaxID=3016206 RepID=A0A9F1U5K0_9FLOR|nr:Succinate dehydrogenase subunit 3 [Melanothamnus gigas]WAX04165.1 Succinate dehydrogenase subunit 3 [Melanothamnus gigas]
MKFLYNFYLSRPYAPHLTIYKLQLSSLSSIFHRLSALLLILGIVFVITIYFSLFNIFLYKNLLFNKFLFIFVHFCKFLFLKFGFFHILNGVKTILCKLNFFKNFELLTFIIKIFFSLIICIILFG